MTLTVTRDGSCPNPPAPRDLRAEVSGNRVSLWWRGCYEGESPYYTNVEIGRQPGASDVLTSPRIGSYGGPAFATTLTPGRYYARARRLPASCDEPSNASPEVAFVIQ